MADINSTIMSGGLKNPRSLDSLKNYSLFLGGTNVSHDVLQWYDPLRTGFGRIFMVRQPTVLAEKMKNKMSIFKHILEYGNTAISGLSDIQVDTQTVQGGYTNKGFDVPVGVTDSTNRLTITVQEFSGSPIREVVHTWINSYIDLMTGLTHLSGNLNTSTGTDGSANGWAAIQANVTAEFIYVMTDSTGINPEYACFFANCFPTNINLDPFNFQSGQHELVSTPLEFTCTKYESIQINKIATALLRKYRILGNSLNFNSGIKETDLGNGSHYDYQTGKLASGERSFAQEAPGQIMVK